MLILSRQDVEDLLTMPETIDAVEKGFRQLMLGKVTLPQRLAMHVDAHSGLHLSMPAFVDGEPGALTVKIVTVFGDNPERYAQPTIQGVVLLHDARTGRPLALMDAEHLTAMRTGAASGVATRHMARKEASVVTIFGAGAQAGPQLIAMHAVRPIRRALVVTRTGVKDASFIAQLSDRLGIAVEATRDRRGAVEAADIICTATNSAQPIFDGAWLRPGTHINAVGACTRTLRELDALAVRRSRVVVDRREAARMEAGDIVLAVDEGAISPDHVVGELGEVVIGSIAGRTDPEEITLFKSVGLALQDAVTAPLVYQRALATGRGREVRL